MVEYDQMLFKKSAINWLFRASFPSLPYLCSSILTCNSCWTGIHVPVAFCPLSNAIANAVVLTANAPHGFGLHVNGGAITYVSHAPVLIIFA
jgi:hypothetical protein